MLQFSTAENADELLEEIAVLSLEEPLRIHMNYWWRTKEEDTDTQVGVPYPSCGMVGCIGGWTRQLTGNKCTAAKTLGLTYDQEHELFWNRKLIEEAGADGFGDGQTLSHAKNVAAHIRAFRSKYRDQLLSTPIHNRSTPTHNS